MDWTVSIITLIAKIPVVRQWWFAPFVGIAIQFVWLWYEWKTQQWGLMLLTVAYIIMWIHAIPKWMKGRNQ